MSDSPNGRPVAEPADLPEALLEEAAIWYARMREPEPERAAAEARQAAFDRWLGADPRRMRAFRDTGTLWDTLEIPVTWLTVEEPATVSLPPSPRWRNLPFMARRAALAASVLIAAGIGLVLQDDVIDRLRSNHMTAVGERAPLTLEDGSRITLNTDTAVAVGFGPDRRHVRLLRGHAWFDIARDRARPFIVDAAWGAIRVTGTSFGVRLDGEAAIVSLTEGRVELAPTADQAGGPPVTLKPGQQARLSSAGVSDVTDFDRTAVTAWLRGQLVFYDTPLVRVVAELNRYRAGRIAVVRGALDRLKVSGVFRTDDPDAALAVIEDTLPVRVIRLTDYLVLLM
jgi:transmembrane sensor